jgi:hypothetical protein
MSDFKDRYVLAQGRPTLDSLFAVGVDDRKHADAPVHIEWPYELDSGECPDYRLVLERAKGIETEVEYKQVLQAIDALFNAPEGSVASAILMQMVLVVETYESVHYPIPEPSPEAMAELRAEMERVRDEQGDD